MQTTLVSEVERRKYNAYHNEWQKEKYKNDPKFREKKIQNARNWRKKNLEKFRKYQRDYQRKLRLQKLNAKQGISDGDKQRPGKKSSGRRSRQDS